MPSVKCCPNCFSKLESYSKPCYFCGCAEFTRTNQLALPLNTVLQGRYVTGKILGAGGFGITYKSFDMKTKKICALKEYVPVNCAMRLPGSEEMTVSTKGAQEIFDYGKVKFLREADTLKQLYSIPDVVKIQDCFEENGTAYFVMEYLEGATLNQLRRAYDGRIPFNLTCEIILRVADCLQIIHEKGNIFHRDISPENIMITKSAEVKVIDFGTAKYIHNQKSQTLSVVLKPGYAPVEQYSTASKQGAFTDVYALASTMYITLTGEKLPPAPDRVSNPHFRPLESYEFLGKNYKELTSILGRALRTKASERTQTMKEFADSLRKFYAKINPVGLNSDDNVVTDPQEDPPVDVTVPAKGYVRPYLIGLKDPVRYLYEIPVNTLIKIGRSTQQNNIVAAVKSVSKEHVELFYSTYEKTFIVKDKKSTNHTYINGKLCRPGKIYSARPGSVLSLAEGACEFRLGIEEMQ